MADGGTEWGSVADWVSGLGSLVAGVIGRKLTGQTDRIEAIQPSSILADILNKHRRL